jgi:adenylosuccinate lyase
MAGLIGAENLPKLEARLAEKLDLVFYPVSNQITPRKQEYELISALAGLAASLHKLAFDLRLLQSPPFGEMSEPFGGAQVGSSAMPFKRNPIRSEKINSLARSLAVLPRIAWDNAALSLLERTLDDSANRRSLLPEAFLLSDELLQTAIGILSGLTISELGMRTNLETYASFSATEPLLAALVKAGADRLEMHAHLRQLAMEAWEQVRVGKINPLPKMIKADTAIERYLSRKEIKQLLDVRTHVGDAPRRARVCALKILTTLGAG